MINYLLRRVVYGILILLGVNLITFVLFFAVNTPDDMARLNLGGRRVTADAQHSLQLPDRHHIGIVGKQQTIAGFQLFFRDEAFRRHATLIEWKCTNWIIIGKSPFCNRLRKIY